MEFIKEIINDIIWSIRKPNKIKAKPFLQLAIMVNKISGTKIIKIKGSSIFWETIASKIVIQKKNIVIIEKEKSTYNEYVCIIPL